MKEITKEEYLEILHSDHNVLVTKDGYFKEVK